MTGDDKQCAETLRRLAELLRDPDFDEAAARNQARAENLKQVVNSVIDDLRLYGLVA